MPCNADTQVGWLHSDGSFKAPPAPPTVEVEALERSWRDAAIESVKWLVERHRGQSELGLSTTLGSDQYRELLTYVQELRDWPQSPGFPAVAGRPTVPGWVPEQT
ncbi:MULTISPECIES: phage tail assembly chaperone [Pseudomonas]|nr:MULTISPECIES: phage tail assembly chaperone [Pseudomonas]